ncbi:MAG: L-threonylcarbamoyladenylate synthase [Acidimicrobiia bacterium]
MAKVLHVGDPATVGAAVAALLAGEAIVVPTETVYGLACRATAPGATSAVFALKGRPADVPLAVLVASLDQALELVEEPSAPARRLIERHWPGPMTVVLRRRADVTVELGGDGVTVGVRCPDHDLVRRLAEVVGPIAATSANRHGRPTPTEAAVAAAALAGEVALVIDGGTCAGLPSTVVDGNDPSLRVLRPGPVTAAHVAAALDGRPGAAP